MGTEHIVLCGGVSLPGKRRKEPPLLLKTQEPGRNVCLQIPDITKRAPGNVPDELLDLLEIATYVYCADQAFTRGGNGVVNVGANWRRRLQFYIPVRKPDLWSQPATTELLTTTLNFLTEDEYTFDFSKLVNPAPLEQYLWPHPEDKYGGRIEEVVLFSGGLDSLAGAVAEMVCAKRGVALVSHRSNPKLDSRQKALVEALNSKAQGKPALHVPVWINKAPEIDREPTQRSRSFLYASLGAAVATLFRLNRMRFYENGTLSFNFPIAGQVIGARATRTTHPQTLNGFANLIGLLLQTDFTVENPFLWKTKCDVVNLIGDAGCADLIAKTVSCVHTRSQTKEHTHCGLCSQCIDRRFGALASKYAEYGPCGRYAVDVLTGAREKDLHLALLESFMNSARLMALSGETNFFSAFGEASRAILHLGLEADCAARQIHELHRRHGAAVTRVLKDAIRQHADAIVERRLPPTCAVMLAGIDRVSAPSPPAEREAVREVRPEQVASDGRRPGRPYTENDKRVYEMVGEPNFRALTNPETQRHYRKQLREIFGDPTGEAARSSLNLNPA